LLNNHTYNNKVDIWAIGCILFEVLFGQKAFSGDYEVLQLYSLGANSRQRLRIPFNTDNCNWNKNLLLPLSEIIHECLDSNPASRPTATTLLDAFDCIFGDGGLGDELYSKTLQLLRLSRGVNPKQGQRVPGIRKSVST
jgi:serine/threonine protein kinase